MNIKNWKRSFTSKINSYDTDGGFIVYVEDYDNEDFDVELISDFISDLLKGIKKDLIAIADEGEYEELRREVEAYFN